MCKMYFHRAVCMVLSFVLTFTVLFPLAIAISIDSDKISSDLQDSLISLESDDVISIVVWFKSDFSPSKAAEGRGFNKETMCQTIDGLHEYRRVLSSLAEAHFLKENKLRVEAIQRFAEITEIGTLSPTIVCEVKKSKIHTIASLDQVAFIGYNDVDPVPVLDVSRKVIKANLIQENSMFGQTGAGINVGVVDIGVPKKTISNLQGADIVNHNGSSVDGHATVVAETIVGQGNGGYPKGIAPDATCYCTGVSNGLISALTWAVSSTKAERPNVNASVDVINISLAYSFKSTFASTDQAVDYFSDHYLTTIVVAAGNFGYAPTATETIRYGVSSPGMAYNAITVGGIKDNNTVGISDDILYTDVDSAHGSSYINTTTVSNKASKPDICAPGVSIFLQNENGIACHPDGTSIAAPHVTGAIALFGQLDTLLLISPPAAKAVVTAGTFAAKFHYVPSNRILTSSPVNPASSYIQYGSGILSCNRSGLIVYNQNYDYFVINSGTQISDFYISLISGKKVRISLAFEHTTTSSTVVSNELDNLNLTIYNPSGGIVSSSLTTNNSLEIVDFTVPSTGLYKIRISRGTSSFTSNVRCAYAWIEE